jgi:hypothetical protein
MSEAGVWQLRDANDNTTTTNVRSGLTMAKVREA